MPRPLRSMTIPQRTFPVNQEVIFQDDFPPGVIGIEFDVDITDDTNTATMWKIEIFALDGAEWRTLGAATRQGGISYERDGTVMTTARIISYWGTPFPVGTLGRVSFIGTGGAVRVGIVLRLMGA